MFPNIYSKEVFSLREYKTFNELQMEKNNGKTVHSKKEEPPFTGLPY